ncbi:MAG: Endoglucanase H precursor [Syntrophorhabdus sp. PtaU1.Bin058]|nr:MAG: Endoglucanase H precursor [Syntrophorhabdus sp. PtaU1.Bin058]
MMGIRSLVIVYYVVIGVWLSGIQAAYADGSLMWGFALDGNPVTEQKLKAMEQESGLRADIIVFFIQWPSLANISRTDFPLESLEAIWDSGAIPCITWEPMYYQDGKEIMIPYAQLMNGKYDQYIKGFAEKARAWGKPFLIRFAHEMNIKRYHWGTEENEYGPRSPDVYKKIFRYVVASFRKTGTHNVLWVFCPNSESVPNTSYNPSASWNILSNYYPGDEYVDILGVDGYNWGTTQTKEKHGWDSRWKTFGEIFERPCMELHAVAPLKPLIVFETASVNSGGSKTEWIYNAVGTSGRLGIQGIVWFQSNKEVDWRINSNGDRSYVSFIRPGRLLPHDWIRRFTKE